MFTCIGDERRAGYLNGWGGSCKRSCDPDAEVLTSAVVGHHCRSLADARTLAGERLFLSKEFKCQTSTSKCPLGITPPEQWVGFVRMTTINLALCRQCCEKR
jgi:hypothetical protein